MMYLYDIEEDFDSFGPALPEDYYCESCHVLKVLHDFYGVGCIGLGYIIPMVNALLFYGRPLTYTAISIYADPPCGEFIKDFDEYEPGYLRPGKWARTVLLDNNLIKYAKYAK